MAEKDPLQALRAMSAGKTQGKAQGEKVTRSRTALFADSENEQAEQANAMTEVTETEIFKILVDNSIDSHTAVDQIANLMVFNFEDTENESQFAALREVRLIIAALIQDFTEQSKQSIQMTRDNPLSELTKSIRSVFENYHSLVKGRESLKGRLELIQGFLEQEGNDEQRLLRALSDAQQKKEEKDRLQVVADGAEGELGKASDALEVLQTRAAQLEAKLAEGKPGFFAGRARKDEYKRWIRELPELAIRVEEERQKVSKATAEFEAADRVLKAFIGDNNFELYEQILEILDIGNDDFKAELQQIANQTLQYIEDTNNTLTGVRDQLSKLLLNVKRNLDVNVNTSEKLNILQKALNQAQDQNAKAYQAFEQEAAAPAIEGVDEFESKRIKQRSTEFITEMSSNSTSATEIAGNMATHQTTLRQLREDLESGVSNADSQLLKAVSTSAATGQTMLQRTERLAAMSQKIVADSMYEQEMSDAFNSVVQDFKGNLEGQLRRNSEIGGFTDLVQNLTEALDAKNDAAIQIATEQQDLVERLSASVSELERANQRSSEIKTEIAGHTADRRAS